MNKRTQLKQMLNYFGKKILILVILWTIFPFGSFSMTNQDSLKIEELTTVLRNQFRERQLDSARLTVDSIKAIAHRAGMELKVADCYSNYGLIERSRGSNQDAIEYFQQAADKYKELEEWALAARSLTAAGQIYISLQMYQPALDHFSQSFQLREQAADSLGMTNNLINMGGAAYFAGWMDESSDYYYRALRLTDALGEKNLRAQILKNMSNIHTRQGNQAKAIEYLEQALDVSRQLGDPKGESDVLLNLGIAWYEKGNLEEAEQAYLLSLEIKEKLQNDITSIARLYNNLGLIAKEREEDSLAIARFNKAVENAKLTNNRQIMAAAYNNLGSIFLKDRMEEAIEMLELSLEYSLELGLRKQVLSSYDNLHQAHFHKGNFSRAYEYLLKHKELNDSLFNVESAARIAELQTQYDTEIKEKENQYLRERARTMQLNIVILSISAFAIAVIAVAFIVLFNLKRKSLLQSRALLKAQTDLNRVEREKSLEKERHLQEVLFAEEEINRLQKIQLEEKDRELTTSTLHMLNKNELLNNFRLRATRVLNGNDCDTRTCIEELIGEIDSNINLDDQWDLFKRHFESVHTGFFCRLKEKYPNLTQNELKLCAYLRMNLSSKEIAQMLNIEVESAITKRYRLRKKMELQSDDNLVSFLLDF